MFFPMWKSLVLVIWLSLVPEGSDSYRFSGSASFARFPSWSGCPNASFSFEFRTTRKSEALLWYVDDGGTSDYCVVSIESSGRVRLEFNTVNENNRSVSLQSTAGLNKGKWHRVEVRRRRMETALGVDGVSTTGLSYGSDFNFGSGSNSFVYLGGLPTDCVNFLPSYALPTYCFEHVKPRFSGSIRNVVYNNCSCQLERVAMVEGNNVQAEDDVCETTNHACPEGNLCMNVNATTVRCDPVNVKCATGNVTHYVLPMDEIHHQQIHNPSGLDAWAFGDPNRREGVIDRALEIDGRSKYIEVSGPGHRHECFGDLTKCLNGYTVALWVFFERPGPTDPFVFLSNGGHSQASHGVAMLYSRRVLEVRFRRKDGKEWTVTSSDVLPHRWCHVAATWHPDKGVFLYVDGELVGSSSVSRNGSPISDSVFNTFVIGRPNDVQSVAVLFPFMVDEFAFWSVYKNAQEIREIGSFFRRYASMDSADDVITGSSLEFRVRGQPEIVPGKSGNALKFKSGRDYLEGNSVDNICLGNLSLCYHGFTISMWVMFDSLQDGTYIFSTGNRGIQLYYDEGSLKGEVWDKNKHYRSLWSGARTGRWYFLELSWLQDEWMKLYVDLREIIEDELQEEVVVPPKSSGSTLYVARGGRDLQSMGSFVIDDLEVWYGDREKLLKCHFIQRDAPTHHSISMDAIENNQIVHSTLHVRLFGRPVITKGRINGALSLDGVDDYAVVEGQKENCFVNLDFCRHGLLLSSWLKLDRIRDGMGILSTGNNGLQVEYVGGQLVVRAQTTTREWRVGTNAVRSNVWVFFEILWDPYRGLALMVDNERVAQNRTSVVRSDWSNETFEQFYVGNGSLTLDDFEFWYSNRVFLMAFGYLSRGRPRDYLIYMDRIQDGRIPNRDLNITVFGNPLIVRGKINSAVQLDGRSQYIDLGDRTRDCLGNLELCNNGFTGSIFLNFPAFHENMFCLSSGGGVDLFMAGGGRLVVLLYEVQMQWKIITEALDKDRWYFIEFTWHRAKGLRVFVDNKLIGQQSSAVSFSHDPTENHFLIGASGSRGGPSNFANILVDDAQFWYGDREELIAFEYILRDSVTYVAFSMERTVGDRVFHPDYAMTLHNGAKLVPGRVGNGALLQGSNQFLALGDQRSSCLGNLELCKNGLTIGFFLNPVRLNDSYLISSGSYAVFFKDGKLWTQFSTKTKTWELSTDRAVARVWQRIDISWDAWRGQQIYINNSLVNWTDSYVERSAEAVSDHGLYIGRPREGVDGGKYARATVDELEFWFAHREHLKGFDVVTDEIQHLLVDMDSIVRDTISHPTLSISVHGSPVTTNGIIGNAVRLNGVGQFIQLDGGDGDLSNFHRGFTLRFKIKPYKLTDNTYWMSSSGFDIFYRNGQVIVQVRTNSGLWEASFSGIKEDMWHQVEVSWHRIDGLKLYVNSSAVEQLTSVKYDGVSNGSRNFYIGKAFTETSLARFANASFDDFQFWKAKRDYLIPDMIDPAYDMALIGVANKVSKVNFEGTSWLHYNFSQMKDFSRWRNVSLQSLRLTLETRNRDGVIWFTETSDHYVTFGIESGKLYLASHTKVGNYSEKLVFDLNVLINTSYELVLSQKSNGEVELVVNNQRFSKTFSQKFSYINPFSFYFGGISRYAESHFVRQNFHGTVSEAVLFDSGHSQTINLVLAALGKLSFVHREDMIKFCATAVCLNGGICKEHFCDCNLTSYAGQLCSEEATGYHFGAKGSRGGGVAVFDLTYNRSSTELSTNEIALGFMTWSKNGTLLRQNSRNRSAHYFSIALVNGYVTIHYDVGKGVSVVGGKEGKLVSDGYYHHLYLFSNGSGQMMLQVDDTPVQLFTVPVSDSSIFSQMDRIELGAKKLADMFFFARLYGIISGVYVNGYQIIDVALKEAGGIHVDTFGDTVVASHPFQVQEPISSTDGDTGNPSFERQVGIVGDSAVEEGGRAAGISGAMLGLLMVASSLMWALYRLKPGVLGADKWQLEADPNITAPLYSGRKSVSDAGAADMKLSTITTEFDSGGYTDMTGMNAANRTSLSMMMSPVPSSQFQDSAGLVAGMNSGTNMTRAGMHHQEASHLMVVSGGNASVNMDSSFGANSGRVGSQAMTSSHQQSVTVVREFHSSAGTSHSQEMSQFSKTGQMVSGGNFVGSSNAGGIVVSTDGSRNISQNVSQMSALKTTAGTSEKSGAVMIVSNFGGNAARNQENSNVSFSSHQVMSGTGEWNGTGAMRTNETGRMMSSETTMHSVVHKTTVGGAVMGQDALHASARDQKTMVLERADLGQQQSAVVNSTQKAFSTDSGMLEGKSGGTVVIQSNFGGTSGNYRDASPVDVIFHKTTQIVESDVRLGRGGLSQEKPELTTSFNYGLSSNVIRDGGGVGKASSNQQKSMSQTSSLKFSSDNRDLGNTEESSGTVVIYSNVGGASGKSSDQSQVDVAFHKTTGRADFIQQPTSKEYSVGQASSLGHRSSAAGVDVSKYDLTRASLKTTATSYLDAPTAKESERSEELLTTSTTRTFTSRTLSPSALSEIKSTTSSENRNLSGDRKGATTLRVQTFGAEHSASSLESEFVGKCLSLDRSIASVKGDPPKTVKVQSPVRNAALPFLLITSQDASSESGGTRVHASLERSSSLLRGQPPKTIKIESPVSPPVAGFSPSASGLNAPSLDRSSSTVKGELPRKLKIESPGRQGGSASTSPNMVNVSDASFQKSSFFTTHHSATSSFSTSGYSGVHSSDVFNVQLPHSSPQFSGSTETAHVECILLTADGQYLVSGSISGPPQVWNMETGEHAKKMEGENLRSTDLHLANNDALLIGRVIKPEQGAISEPKSSCLGKLQIWDFGSGKPLKMQKNETFTASFLMSDGAHIALGRTETAGPGKKLSVVIVIWDILANQPKRKISYQAGKMTADHLTYVNQSSDRRYLVAGFKNNETGNATYLTFDLAASNFDVSKPTVTELEADVKNTAILRDHEAVTGTRVGGLVFWSLKTGKLIGQLVAPPGEAGSSRAHRMEPRDLVVSKDGRYLVSASADATLCLWNLDTKLHVRTFTGHTDEVTCCAISNDNELLVSGSRDKSIRLWHLADGTPMTSIHADAAIVKVLLSNDKQTVAALAEHGGKRRLVMMRVVRTKVRKSTTSRGESSGTP